MVKYTRSYKKGKICHTKSHILRFKMPGYVIHLAVAKKQLEFNKVKNEDEFIKGIIAPDLLKKQGEDSHYGYSSKPNIKKFLKGHDLKNDYDKGYFVHLATDLLFYDRFLSRWSSEIYDDYDILNKKLIEKYNIQIPKEVEEYVHIKDGELKKLSLKEIIEFIEGIGKLPLEDTIKKYIEKEGSKRGGINMREQIIMASGNKGKIKEAQEILKDYEVIPMNQIGIDIDVEEDKPTFKGNAMKKAEEIAKMLNGKKCLADDSGIEIEYLNGFPGVYTKRWNAGTDRDRNLAIIEKLKGVPKEKRKIKFITAIALSDGKKTVCVEGVINGYVAENVRGDNGFGFDEIFELENGKTLAEISEEEKNRISARKKALEGIKNKLNEQIR